MYECDEYPCLHLVVDYSSKYLAVFLETSDGEIIWVPLGRVLNVAEKAAELLGSGFREARGEEVDELAYKYLDAFKEED